MGGSRARGSLWGICCELCWAWGGSASCVRFRKVSPAEAHIRGCNPAGLAMPWVLTDWPLDWGAACWAGSRDA